MEKRVRVEDLKLGMYVSQLDRPWLEVPFLFQGFHIDSRRDIERLQRYCSYVYIDVERGESADRYLDPAPNPLPVSSSESPLPRRTVTYEDAHSAAVEIKFAREIHGRMRASIINILDDAHAGRKLNLSGAQEDVDGMIESILRNPDAFLWLTQLKSKDAYSYSHALGACTLAVAFGRHLGLPKPDLRHMAMGSLLFDVGKMKLPPELLAQPGPYTEEEFELMKKHVVYGVEIMSQTHGIKREVIDIAVHHHERHDGGGYLQGLQGTQIPVFGRMAGIIDCYDAITSARPYCAPLSPHDAVKKLYEWRNVDFQEELVEQFIQCLGVYPTGTLVELSTGQVGVVIAQNRTRRLKPKIMLILDPDKTPYEIFPTVDLTTDAGGEAGGRLEITRALEPGTLGIDPAEFYL